jgi:myo-inositol-1(or 4)-monophosphatase
VTESLLDAVGAIAAETGAMALANWQGDYRRWEKAPGDPVSEIDLAADRMLRERLLKLDPEAGWLSEETADSAERLMGSRTWVVDPIDGTRDFIRGRSGWAVSVALVEGGKVMLGVLDAPVRKQQWRAEAGAGAFLNGQRLRVTGRTQLPGARVPADTLPKTDADLVAVPRPNSIALRIAMLAAGEVDLVATLRWGREWDIAAAFLIAEEAGAVVTDARGAPIRFNSTKAEAFGLLASVPGIHAAAVERLAARAAKASVR